MVAAMTAELILLGFLCLAAFLLRLALPSGPGFTPRGALSSGARSLLECWLLCSP